MSPRKPRTFARARHGAAKRYGVGPVIEVPPHDELPKPVTPAPAPPGVPLTFREDGRIADSATASELGRRGGLAKANRVRLLDSLGLKKFADNDEFAPYRHGAEEFVKHHLLELGKITGGVVSSGPSTMVSSAALQLAASRWAFDKGGTSGDAKMMVMGSSFANDAKTNLLAAYSYAALEARARPSTPVDPLAGFRLPEDDA